MESEIVSLGMAFSVAKTKFLKAVFALKEDEHADRKTRLELVLRFTV
jgi:hypothetical protein